MPFATRILSRDGSLSQRVTGPALVGAVKTEMVSQECRVRVELIEISEFLERYPGSSQRLQSQQRRMESPKTGREEKTRKRGV